MACVRDKLLLADYILHVGSNCTSGQQPENHDKEDHDEHADQERDRPHGIDTPHFLCTLQKSDYGKAVRLGYGLIIVTGTGIFNHPALSMESVLVQGKLPCSLLIDLCNMRQTCFFHIPILIQCNQEIPHPVAALRRKLHIAGD